METEDWPGVWPSIGWRRHVKMWISFTLLPSVILVILVFSGTNFVGFGIMPYDPGEPNHSEFEWENCVEADSERWIEFEKRWLGYYLAESAQFRKSGNNSVPDLTICFHTGQLSNGGELGRWPGKNIAISHSEYPRSWILGDWVDIEIEIFCQTPGDYSFYSGENNRGLDGDNFGRTLNSLEGWGNSTRYWSGVSYADKSMQTYLPSDSYCQLRAYAEHGSHTLDSTLKPGTSIDFTLEIKKEGRYWADLSHWQKVTRSGLYLPLVLGVSFYALGNSKAARLAWYGPFKNPLFSWPWDHSAPTYNGSPYDRFGWREGFLDPLSLRVALFGPLLRISKIIIWLFEIALISISLYLSILLVLILFSESLSSVFHFLYSILFSAIAIFLTIGFVSYVNYYHWVKYEFRYEFSRIQMDTL